MIRIGVIGVGHLGKIHLNCLKNIPTAEIVGLYDSNETIALEVSEKHNTAYYSNATDLLNACDAVTIVAPTTCHHELAMQALKMGKHVFLEKPIASTLKESEEIIAYSKQNNLKVQVGHVERFNDAYLSAKPYLGSPMFIEAHRLAEFNVRGTDVSVVLDLMIHDLDIVLNMVKSPVRAVHASGVAVVSDTPDIANVRIEFENGATANLTASRIAMKKMRRMRLFQKNMYITIDFLEKKTNVIRLRDAVAEDENEMLPLILDLGEGKPKKRIFIESPQSPNANAIETELSLFIDCITNNTPCEVSAEDGHNALKLAYQIMEKIQQNEET
ncbi:MAG: Gfo/Idh/MocA family oxidoreductase [Lentimicrobiaceae bacterium]|nr:Gfo/Idh/MocA family oxidoreductase [Lentimicrobiaceae bacterium]